MPPVGKTAHDIGRYAGVALVVALILIVVGWYVLDGNFMSFGTPTGVTD